MLQRLLFYSMLCIIINSPLLAMVQSQVYGRVLPIHQSTKDGKWYALFAKNKNENYWNDFGQISTGGKANIAAQQALAKGTANLYNVQIAGKGYPWVKEKIGHDEHYFHFIPVTNWVKASDLYKKAGPKGTQAKADFKWIALVDRETEPIARTIKQVFNNNWPEVKKKLRPVFSTSTQTTKPVTQSPAQPKPTQVTTAATPLSKGATKPATWQIPGAIFFYESGKPYYEFTNFYPAQFTLDGKVWPTSEHYFQAQKSTDPQVKERIRQLKAPRDAFDYFRNNPALVRSDWKQVNIPIMKKVVKAKFSQNPALKKLLLSTSNKVLVEDAKGRDAFWGAGADMKGENWLGRILMQVRTELSGN